MEPASHYLRGRIPALSWHSANGTVHNNSIIWQIPDFKGKRLFSLFPGAFTFSVIETNAFLKSYLSWLSFLPDLCVNMSVLKALSFFHKPPRVWIFSL